MEERYFYHSFARPRKGCNDHEKNVKILESIIHNGLLLVPEKWVSAERLENGELGPQDVVFQKRVCFTELQTPELKQHSETFGSFALEWEIGTLLELHAMPIMYLPKTGEDDSSIGATTLARLSEVRLVLSRLNQLLTYCETNPQENTLMLNINGGAYDDTGIPTNSIPKLMRYVTSDTQPLAQLENFVQVFSNFFYPTSHPKYSSSLLDYYYQREWRIVAGLKQGGEMKDKALTEDQKAQLMDIDGDFFGKTVEFPTGQDKLVNQCRYYCPPGTSIMQTVKRLIVPDDAVKEVNQLLKNNGIAKPVHSLSEIA